MVKPHEENPIECGTTFRLWLLGLFLPTYFLMILIGYIGPDPPNIDMQTLALRLSLNPVALMLSFIVSDLRGPSPVLPTLCFLFVGHIEWYCYGYLLDIANFRSKMRRHKRQSNNDICGDFGSGSGSGSDDS